MLEVKLDAADAAELAEMLQFLNEWLAGDPARLATSLEQFVGAPAYGVAQLHDDLERFTGLSNNRTASGGSSELEGGYNDPLFDGMRASVAMNARMSVIACCRLRALLPEYERYCMVANMSVHSLAVAAVIRRGAQPLLDVAAEVLVADPAASLAEVATAAGIGRTTLHQHYATRADLLYAVGHRALDLLEQALNEATAAEHADGGLHALVAELIPIGPQLAFLWRTPAFDHMKDLDDRWLAVQERSLAVLRRAQELGILAADLPDWWLGQMLSSVVYVAASSVQAGRLAPLDAPGLALRTLLRGTGAPQPSLKETS